MLFTTSFDYLMTLVKYATTDISVVTEPKWREAVKGLCIVFRNTITKVRAIQPKSKFQKSHKRWLEFATHLDKATTNLEKGMDSMGPELAESGTQFSKADIAMHEALKEMTDAAGP